MKPLTQPDHQPRAVLYLRQSVAKEESISLELQEAAGREYCARQGYRVVAVEADPGISGRTWKRPAVVRVMSMLDARDADVIVLWKWSRLSRSRLDWALAIDRVEGIGGRIESATEPLDTTTSTGRLARGMLTEFAAFESERIGDVWRETHERRINQGLTPSGGKRFGYIVDGRQYVPDPATGPQLTEMYRSYADLEHGFSRLAKTLNHRAIMNLRGRPWTPGVVITVLDSGFGAGLIISGTSSKNPRYTKGAHDPVIDEGLWARYQARRLAQRIPARRVEPASILSGLMVCADCESAMSSSQRGREKGYVCMRQRGTGIGRSVTCYQSHAVQFVRDWVRDWPAISVR